MMKADIPLGMVYFCASLLSLGFIFKDAMNYTPSVFYGLIWIIAYHGFWCFLIKSIKKLFPGIMTDDA